MKSIGIDIETRSSVDLTKAGVYRYAEAEDFRVILFACSVDDGPVQIFDLLHGEALPGEIRRALQDPEVEKWSFNSNFERVCLSRFLGYPVGTYLPPEGWRCSMTWAGIMGLPMKLKDVCAVLKLEAQKMDAGADLIKRYSLPPYEEPPADDPDWQLFMRYCEQDVECENALRQKLAPWPVSEALWQEFWDSERINDRGVAIDREIVKNAIQLNALENNRLMERLKTLTGLENPNSVPQMKQWLLQQGVLADNLDKNAIRALMEKTSLLEPEKGEVVREVLELRLMLGKTSTKKYAAMAAGVNADGRIRGLFRFYGANRTGRFASRQLQLQNLPKNKMEDLDKARELLKAGKFLAFRREFPDVQDALSQVVRTAIVAGERSECAGVARKGTDTCAPAGASALKGDGENSAGKHSECAGVARKGTTSHALTDASALKGESEKRESEAECCGRLLVADESAIEARILAWLAGEKWRVQAFADGKDIYSESASQMFHVPVVKNDINGELRAKGKVAELALGYQGGAKALIRMGALEMGLTEKELPGIVSAWRAASPNIVRFWYDIGEAAMNAVKYRASVKSHGFVFSWEKGILFITLLSGRRLAYFHARLGVNEYGEDCVTYKGAGPESKWQTLTTYGGRLTENIIQATARDVLCYALGNLRQTKVIGHVHDEAILEDDGSISLEELCSIMGRTPPWAPGLLLKAEGFVTPYYRKD